MNAEELKKAREICDRASENPRLYSSEIVFTVLPAALDRIEELEALLTASHHIVMSNGNYEILKMFQKLKENDQEGHVFIVPARHVGRSVAINTMLNLNNTKLAKQKDELQKENERLQAGIKELVKAVCVQCSGERTKVCKSKTCECEFFKWKMEIMSKKCGKQMNANEIQQQQREELNRKVFDAASNSIYESLQDIGTKQMGKIKSTVVTPKGSEAK